MSGFTINILILTVSLAIGLVLGMPIGQLILDYRVQQEAAQGIYE